MPRDSRRALELFRSALDLEGERLAAFLSDACGSNADLRQEVEELLEQDRQPAAGLDESQLLVRRAELDGLLPRSEVPAGFPERIGEYRIVRCLGRGGMGIVYEAEQEQPRRKVALKVIHPGATQQHLARFRHEAQVLGLLQHPSIAQIYEADTYDLGAGPQPFFVMELVDGEDLQTWANQSGRTLEQKLEVFLRICAGVQYAHQKGVVHRDLKPDNVLITGESEPKILDFGVARATDADLRMTSMETGLGQLIGTIAYMSPEQATGNSANLDARSDIYTLGVLLFELLTGRLPHAVAGRPAAEVLRSIQEDDPTSLRTLDTSLRGDLDTIVKHALEKEPGRRYDSAAALGSDIQSFLRHLPIAARRPSATYQLAKFVRRHKGFSAGLAGTILTLASGLVVSTSLYLRADRARAAEAREAEKARAIRDYILVDMLEAASPYGMGGEVRVADVLRSAVERVDTTFSEYPVTAASVRQVLGSALVSLGQGAEAKPLLEQAWREHEALLGAEHRETLEAKVDYAMYLLSDNLDPKCVPLLESLLEADFGDSQAALAVHLRVAGALADFRAKSGEESGLSEAREVLDRSILALGSDHPRTVALRNRLISSLARFNRFEEAEALAREQIELLTGREGENLSPGRIIAEQELGHLLFNQGRYEEGRATVEGLLTDLAEAFGADHVTTLVGRGRYATLLSDYGDLDPAERVLREVLPRLEAVVGKQNTIVMVFRNNLAIVLRKQGRLKEALPVATQNLADRREVRGPDHVDVAQSLDVLAVIQMQMGKKEEALAGFQEAVDIQTRNLGAEHPQTLDGLYNLAWANNQLGSWAAAEELYLSLVDSHRRVSGEEHPDVGLNWHQVARMRRFSGRLEEAEVAARNAYELRERIVPDWHIHRYDSKSLLGMILAELGRFEEAEPLLIESIAGFTRIDREPRALSSGTYDALLLVHEGLGHEDEASLVRERIGRD